MKIFNTKFLQYAGFSMAAGLISSIIAAVGCCMIYLFFLIPILPIAFIISWIIGCILGWLSSKNEYVLPIYTYLWSIMGFSIVSFLLLYLWLYSFDLRYSMGYAVLSSVGFAICSFPAIYYLRKKIIPEMFIPPIPKNHIYRK